MGRSVAVPSRLCRRAGAGPLSGVRIIVKDMFEMSGIGTSIGNRSYLQTYGVSKTTAPAIQTLLDCGAEILGLANMCSTVLFQHPTQCIDFAAPFNPRGDGYQSPSGGSSGSAAAIASYEWLDVAVASDCKIWPATSTLLRYTGNMKLILHSPWNAATASGRLPALANGCFSCRPTRGAISTEGMWSGVR